jgi:hypothetical protein
VSHFDRVVVISLARRPDRLAGFYARLAGRFDACPYPATDGQEDRPPAWWKTTPGAWGCYQSHRAVIDYALAIDIESILIFEDDATFVPDFTERLAGLEVPADCQMLYLGGQHLTRAEPGPPGLVRGRNVNRTHAYAVFGRPALELLRDHLRPDPALWTARHHIDHHYGLLHRRRRIAVYAVSPWLCGQAAGVSDVSGRPERERAWR